MNPNRSCKMCARHEDLAGDGEKADSLPNLIELCRAFSSGDGPIHEADYEKQEKENGHLLRVAANGCPACMLAAIRQSGTSWVNFDWKKESKEWWADHQQNDSRYY